MPAVPARVSVNLVLQDNRGFKARCRFIAFDPDVSTDANLISDAFTNAAAVGAAVAGMSNAKVVATGFAWDFDIAQEPASETGTYQLVQDKAVLTFGDGTVLKSHGIIPAPRDALFLTTSQDNLIVVDRASSELSALQSALAHYVSPAGGVVGSQFFGGQYQGHRSRRRRVLQGT